MTSHQWDGAEHVLHNPAEDAGTGLIWYKNAAGQISRRLEQAGGGHKAATEEQGLVQEDPGKGEVI